MATKASMERIFERVQLVRGKGDRSTAQLCIMSFVALLAGEGHSDSPKTASLFIRRVAISLNDAMSDVDRQRLKLFAPRILGTNDGMDAERSRLACRVVTEEVLPRIRADLDDDWLPQQFARDWPSIGNGMPTSHNELFLEYVGHACSSSSQSDNVKAAELAAKLLVSCARASASPDNADWYWSKAIDLLDRLCDVGAASRLVALHPDQITRAGETLDCASLDGAALLASRILRRTRQWLGLDTPAMPAAVTPSPKAAMSPAVGQNTPPTFTEASAKPAATSV